MKEKFIKTKTRLMRVGGEGGGHILYWKKSSDLRSKKIMLQIIFKKSGALTVANFRQYSELIMGVQWIHTEYSFITEI